MKKVVPDKKIFLLFLSLFLCGCNHRSKVYLCNIDLRKKEELSKKREDFFSKDKKNTCLARDSFQDIDFLSNEPEHSITIWIYGTLLLKKSFFYKHFNGEIGLKPVHEVMKTSCKTSEIAFLLAEQNSTRFPLEKFYFFGWTGKLDEHEREQAALCLLENIKQLIAQHREQYNVNPKITIISHSHGGNIALFMPALVSEDDEKPIIDTLILLACPVQRKTMPFVYNDMFKKIYALYSSLDMIQVLAPQHPYYKPFSSKKFPKNKKMIQASVKMNGKALLHTSFTKKRFISSLPFVINELNAASMKLQSEDMFLHKEIALHIKI